MGTQNSYPFKKGEIIELHIDSVAYGGKGVGRYEGFVVFVKNALPGQLLRVRIVKRRSSYAEGMSLEVLSESPLVVEAPCPYFRECGGCSYQNLPYSEQLKIKKQQVEDVYRHLTRLETPLIRDVLPSPQIWGYRNKMEFSAGDARWLYSENDPGTAKDFAIGLHAPGRFDKILDIDSCLLQDDQRNAILQRIRAWAAREGITLNNPRRHSGFLRNIMIRSGGNSGEIMVNFISRDYQPKIMESIVKELTENFSDIVSITNNVTDSMGMSSRGQKEYVLAGRPVIHDRIGSVDYEISPNSFFQTNTRGAENLYEVVRSYASQREGAVIWDFYSGTGSIALYLADSAEAVYGFEIVADAVKNANENARKNGLDNCRFFEADLDRFHRRNQDLIRELKAPDIAVVDPPRAGLAPKFLEQLLELKAGTLIYVSCNPSTQARDVEALKVGGYRLVEIQPVDMFPHTWHVEAVALLQWDPEGVSVRD